MAVSETRRRRHSRQRAGLVLASCLVTAFVVSPTVSGAVVTATCTSLGEAVVEASATDGPRVLADAVGQACIGIDGVADVNVAVEGVLGCDSGDGAATATMTWGDGDVSVTSVALSPTAWGIDITGPVTSGRYAGGTVTGRMMTMASPDVSGRAGCGVDTAAVRTPIKTYLVVMPPAADAAVGAAYVGLFTDVDIDPDQSFSPDELAAFAENNAVTRVSDIGNVIASPTDVVTGETPSDTVNAVTGGLGGTELDAYDGTTERGYLLRRPGYVRQQRHLYESDPLYATHWSCYQQCTIDSKVKVWFRYYINGGSSRLWKIRFRAQQIFGSRGYRTWYEYYCAVNIKDAIDKYCPYFKQDGADESDISSFYDGDYAWYHFGNYYKVTKFPMVNIHLMWSSSQEATYAGADKPGARFRGWDVCVTAASTLICPTSGDGT